MVKKNKKKKSKAKEYSSKSIPTLTLRTDTEVAMDFSSKIYQKFQKIIKAVILFGSTAKQTATKGSDIDIVIILDDVSVKWTNEMIVWYREGLDSVLQRNPYNRNLHINTVKLSTWWQDLMRGDPVVINILRYGEAMLDIGGFFEPIKQLLIEGKIRSTPEAIYNCLQRAPKHLAQSRVSELNAIEGLYWAMVDSAHAALIAAGILPSSPEHIPVDLKVYLVDKGKLKMEYVTMFRDMLILHKQITHGDITNLKGAEIDMWQEKTENFMEVMARLVNDLIS